VAKVNLWEGARRFLSACVALALAIPIAAQKPSVFDVSEVVVGAQKTPTLNLYAVGKWSDAGEHVGALSTEIQCYKALGFCDVASAEWNGADAIVDLTTFDILRWDSKEIIAADSSPICVVNTLRADLVTKRVTLSSSDKGVTTDPFCKGSDKLPTIVLLGANHLIKDEIQTTKPKK
jgi:hypothetical protein